MDGYDQLAFKPLPEVEGKVSEPVQDCYLSRRSLKAALTNWVEKELVPQHLKEGIITIPPSAYSHAYYPTVEDIRSMTWKALIQQ